MAASSARRARNSGLARTLSAAHSFCPGRRRKRWTGRPTAAPRMGGKRLSARLGRIAMGAR
eukprot:10198968-Alexandrium_andersonii.AAC.1